MRARRNLKLKMNVVEDTTPRFGGNLDVQDFTLSSSGSGFIQLHDNTIIDGTLLANGVMTVNMITPSHIT